MKNKIFIPIFIFVLVSSNLSGCVGFFSSSNQILIYESSPTKINYTITYGYKINCTGQGKYSIFYNLDFPEVLNGNVLSTSIHNDDYQLVNLATYNDMIKWDFNSSENTDYALLITAEVYAENFLISNLNEKDALTIEEISKFYTNIVNRFCGAQSNETTIFVNPFDEDITETAVEIYSSLKTNNSFLVAKGLFAWFKQHTTYKAHFIDDDEIQSAHTTLVRGTGDCDDLSFLYISLCRALGIPARFIKGFLLDGNSMVQHVWVEVFVGEGIGKNGWIPVECAGTSADVEPEVNQNFGIENVEHLRLFTDDGSNDSLNVSFSGITYRIFSESRSVYARFYIDISDYFISKSQQLVVDENGIRSYR